MQGSGKGTLAVSANNPRALKDPRFELGPNLVPMMGEKLGFSAPQQQSGTYTDQNRRTFDGLSQALILKFNFYREQVETET